MINRRTLLKSASVPALGFAAPAFLRSASAATPIKMAALLDQSGGLELLGTPMLEATKLAVKEINASGDRPDQL
jgi:urea transport system substrate-binding protein